MAAQEESDVTKDYWKMIDALNQTARDAAEAHRLSGPPEEEFNVPETKGKYDLTSEEWQAHVHHIRNVDATEDGD